MQLQSLFTMHWLLVHKPPTSFYLNQMWGVQQIASHFLTSVSEQLLYAELPLKGIRAFHNIKQLKKKGVHVNPACNC